MLAQQRGEAAELLWVQVAFRHLHLDRRVPRLLLRAHRRPRPLLERRAVGVGRLVGVGRRLRCFGLLVVEEQQRVGRGVTALRPVLRKLLIDHAAELFLAHSVDQELEARLGDVLPQLVGGIEDAQHGLGDQQVVVDGDPLAQHDRVAGHDREPAPGDHLEALGGHAVDLADLRDEADVVDLCQRGVLVAAGEGHLELAREQLRQVAAHEVAHEGARVRRHVERLVVADARPGVAGHVAHGVAARLARRQPGGAEDLHDVVRVGEREVVQLHRLARRQVALAERREVLRDHGEGFELLRGGAAEWQFHAHHLPVRLALAVHALAQTELGEVVGLAVLSEELGRFRLEVLELFLEDRDHAARAVGTCGGRHRALHPGRAGVAVARPSISRRALTGILSSNFIKFIDNTRSYHPRSSCQRGQHRAWRGVGT